MNTKPLHVFQSQQLTVWHDFLFLPSGSAIRMDGTSVGGRLARALLHAHGSMPGVALQPEALFAAIWPDAPFDERSRTRLKVAVCRLRAVGVPILTLGQSYVLDPRIALELAAMPRAAA